MFNKLLDGELLCLGWVKDLDKSINEVRARDGGGQWAVRANGGTELVVGAGIMEASYLKISSELEQLNCKAQVPSRRASK